MDRLHHRGSHTSEKKKDPGSIDSVAANLNDVQEDPNEDAQPPVESDDKGPRKVYFNIPLPQDALNDTGYPKKSYGRNKIRTAKYTPLSFIPKNLWL